jgi:hypothetical protein
MNLERAKLWWALAAVITLQLFIVYYQLNYGALVGLIPWDDCAIIERGLRNISALVTSHSLRQVLGVALHLDIHAPVSDIQTIVGLLLTGGAIWGPYALNVTCLYIAIYAISMTAALKNSILFGTIVLFLLVQPITILALSTLKSDWQGGLLLATALVVLFDAAEKNSNYSRSVGGSIARLIVSHQNDGISFARTRAWCVPGIRDLRCSQTATGRERTIKSVSGGIQRSFYMPRRDHSSAHAVRSADPSAVFVFLFVQARSVMGLYTICIGSDMGRRFHQVSTTSFL